MIRRFLNRTLLLAGAVIYAGCGGTEPTPSTVHTDLGNAGNKVVVDTFARYQAKPGGCYSNHGGRSSAHRGSSIGSIAAFTTPKPRRILLTGFGPFASHATSPSLNISGIVVRSLTRRAFLPDSHDLSQPQEKPFDRASQGTMPLGTEHHGGLASVREINIGGEQHEVCFLLLDVIWDLAAAVIIHEINNFDPDTVIMTGLGGDPYTGFFEGGAINQASRYGSFGPDGNYDATIQPVRDGAYILPPNDRGVSAEILMRWNPTALSRATFNAVQEIDSRFLVVGLEKARPSNDYICNNVSYVVLHAIKGIPVRLAGEQLTLFTPGGVKHAGFFHYPLRATHDDLSILRWGRSLALAIQASGQY